MSLVRNIILVLATISFASALFFYFFNIDILIKYIINFSPDGVLSFPQVAIERFIFFHLFFISCLLIFPRRKIVNQFLNSYKETNTIHKISFILIIFLILFYFIFYFQPLALKLSNLHSLYAEDTGFETMTAVFLSFASVLIIFSLQRRELLYSKLIKILIFAFSLLFFLEEISWGQRILDFKTPDFLVDINVQKESNIHNIFNFLFPVFYPIFSFLFFFVFFFVERIKGRIQHLVDESLFPAEESKGYSLIAGFLFLTCILLPSHNYDNELLEEVYSVIILAYCLDQFRIARLSALNNIN